MTSPWTWLGALILAAAILLLGHTSAEAAGDGSDQPALLASVVATADGDVAPVTEPVTATLRQVPVPAVDTATALVAPLTRTLTSVTGMLPAPVSHVARDVVDALPAAAGAETVAPPEQRPVAAPAIERIAAAPDAVRAAGATSALDPDGPSARPRTPDAAPAGVALPDPTSPWLPGQQLPPLPAGAPGAGGLTALTGGLSGATLAGAAVLALLLPLVMLARARMAAPLALRSAMHASRMRRPG